MRCHLKLSWHRFGLVLKLTSFALSNEVVSQYIFKIIWKLERNQLLFKAHSPWHYGAHGSMRLGEAHPT